MNYDFEDDHVVFDCAEEGIAEDDDVYCDDEMHNDME